MKQVITLQNGSSLNEQQFVKYFEKKVLYTIRKFDLFKDIKQRPQVHELFKLKKIGTYIISLECLDDISLQVLRLMMRPKAKQRLSQLLPLTSTSGKKIIRPFYLMSKQEMLLYMKITKIKIRCKLNDSQFCLNSPQNLKDKKQSACAKKTEVFWHAENLPIFKHGKLKRTNQLNLKLTSDLHLKRSAKENLKLTSTSTLTSELSSFLDELEKQQKNVKNSIVSSLLKIQPFIDK